MYFDYSSGFMLKKEIKFQAIFSGLNMNCMRSSNIVEKRDIKHVHEDSRNLLLDKLRISY